MNENTNDTWTDYSGLKMHSTAAKKVPGLRLTMEVEGLTIGDVQDVLRALEQVEIPFTRASTIVEVMED